MPHLIQNGVRLRRVEGEVAVRFVRRDLRDVGVDSQVRVPYQVDDLGVVRVHARFYDARALDHSIHYMMVVARQDEGKVEVPRRFFILILVEVAQRQDEVRAFIS